MPPTSVRNFTPTSTAALSFESIIQGTVIDGVQMLQGHTACVIVTDVDVDGCSTLPLSSLARERIVAAPRTPGTQV